MPVVIPNSFVAGQLARASQVNANFNALKAKFTEAAGGISDGDIATNADINSAAKLSSTDGKRITTQKMADDAVDGRVLRNDLSAGAPDAAVNLQSHIKDGLIPKSKLSTALNERICVAQLDIDAQEVAFSIASGGHVGVPFVSVWRTITPGPPDVYTARLVFGSSGLIGTTSSFLVTPPGPLVVANRKLFGLYVMDLSLGGGFFTGKVVFTSMINA